MAASFNTSLLWIVGPWLLILAVAILGRLLRVGATARSDLYTAFALVGRGLAVGVVLLIVLFLLQLALTSVGRSEVVATAATATYMGLVGLFTASGYVVLAVWPAAAWWRHTEPLPAMRRQARRAALLSLPWLIFAACIAIQPSSSVWSLLLFSLLSSTAYLSVLVLAWSGLQRLGWFQRKSRQAA